MTRKKQFLLKYFKIRVIFNGKDIYYLEKDGSVLISFNNNDPKIVVTDGYHYTKPLEIVFNRFHTYYFKIVCAIDDNKLYAGLLLLITFFSVGMISDIFIAKILSFLPILYFLYLYYINRKDFIQIKAA